MKRKKYLLLPIALSIVLLVTGLFTAYASSGATVYTSSISLNAGQTIKIPILIKNNTGLAGAKLTFTYDADVMTPISVENGDVFSSGIQDNIEGDAVPGQFNVYWASATGDNNSLNGILFYINFNVSDSAYGGTKLEISYNQADTFDENFNDVSLNCENVNLKIKNDEIDSRAKIILSASIKNGKYVDVNLHITNADKLNSSVFKIGYDESTFSYNSISGNADLISNAAGVVKINAYANSADENSDFVTIRFALSNTFKSGKYPFSVSADSQNILCEGCEIELSTLVDSDTAEIYIPKGIIAEKGKQISIPVLINYNQGIMGYRLSFNYNASILKIKSAESGENFVGTVSDSIGNKSGTFDVVWSATSNNKANGTLLYLTFDVISDNSDKINTQIGISYTQSDTFNEDYDDIGLNCTYGEISICPGHTYTSSVIKPECESKGYTAYVCNYCGTTYYDSYTQSLGHYYVYQNQSGATLPKSSVLNYKCKYCDKTYSTSASELLNLWQSNTQYINSKPGRDDINSQLFDISYDNAINAKDYAMINYSYKSK